MGGKSKQRTKNNVRPSSSGRSAVQLNSVPLDGSGGVVNIAGKQLPALFPTLAAPTLDPLITPELQLCFKKLHKKDPITKSKALQELTELVTQSKVDDVVAALPSWTHFYKILSIDGDRKVRELTQVCHGAIVGACGRRVAPHLKRLMPAWLAALHDHHAPARTPAARALLHTFPEGRLPTVLAFCKEEILAHLLDELAGPGDAPTSKKSESGEEAEESRARGAGAALCTLRALLARLPAPERGWLLARLEPALAAPAFWKLAKHPAPALRAAWFAALGSLVSADAPEPAARLGARLGARLARELARREDAALVAAAQWDCLLAFVLHVENWAEYFEKKEALGKKILEVLENGGWGDARHLAAVLPPLLAHLPPDMLTDDYLAAFFDAHLAGLDKRTVASSKSEQRAWVSSVEACVRHAAQLERGGGAALVARVHRAWLQRALAAGDAALRATAAALAALARSWLHGAAPHADRLLRAHWHNVAATLDAQTAALAAAPADAPRTLAAHLLLLRELRAAAEAAPRPRRSVAFAGDEPTPPEEEAAPVAWEPGALQRYRHELGGVAAGALAAQLRLAREPAAAGAVAAPLVALATEFDSVELYDGAAARLGARSASALYHDELAGWLARDGERRHLVVELALLLGRHLDDANQNAVFASFDAMVPGVGAAVLCACASGARRGWGAVRAWARGAGGAHAALQLARRAHSDPRAADALLDALRDDPQHGSLLSETAIADVISELAAALRDEHAEQAAARAELAARAAGACAAPRALLLALLQRAAEPDAAAALRRAATRAWRAAPLRARAALHEQVAELLRARLPAPDPHTSPDFDLEEIERLAALAAEVTLDEEPPEEEVSRVTSAVLPAEARGAAAVEAAALRCDVLRARLSCPFADSAASARVLADAAPLPARAALAAYCADVAFRAAFLAATLRARAAPPPEHGARLLHDRAVLATLRDGYALAPGSDVVRSTTVSVDVAVGALLAESATPARDRLATVLASRAATEGYYWSYAAADYERRVRGVAEGEEDEAPGDVEAAEPPCSVDTITGSGFFHTLQAHGAADAALLVAARCVLAEAGSAPRDLDALIEVCYARPDLLLADTCAGAAAWGRVASAAGVADALREAVTRRGWDAAPAHWDFINITLCSLLARLDRDKEHWHTTKVAMLGAATLRLLCAAAQFVRHVRAGRGPPAGAAPHVAHLPAEWDDVFVPDLAANLYSLLAFLLDSSASIEIEPSHEAVIGGVIEALPCVGWEQIPAARCGGPLELARLVRAASAVLGAPAPRALHYLAYAALGALRDAAVLHDAEVVAAWNAAAVDDEEEGGSARPALLFDVPCEALAGAADAVDAALEHVRAGEETCAGAAGTEVGGAARGLLLLARAVERACGRARGELAAQCAARVREAGAAEALLRAALRLLPARVLADALHAAPPPPAAADTDMFTAEPSLDLAECEEEAVLGRLACGALRGVVAGAGGAAARAWRGGACRRAAAALDALVARHVTPPLVRAELAALAARPPPAVHVRVNAATREAWARLALEERDVELAVSLARTHPLALPSFSAPSAPVGNTQWLVMFVAHRGGRVADAVRMWAESVASRVERSSQCYICYCRLHPASGRLPNVTCHTCNNKYHNVCLRKWFSTSSKSNCPLCRTKF